MKQKLLLAATLAALFWSGLRHVNVGTGALAYYNARRPRPRLASPWMSTFISSREAASGGAALAAAAAAAIEEFVDGSFYETNSQSSYWQVCWPLPRWRFARSSPFHRFAPGAINNGEALLRVTVRRPGKHVCTSRQADS